MSYSLAVDRVQMTMEATTTRPTPVSMINHAYYNLAGHAAGADELYEHRHSNCSAVISTSQPPSQNREIP